MKIPKIENFILIVISLIIIIIFSYIVLGYSGMVSILGIISMFILPIYVILNNFNLNQDEKIVYSFFIGVGIIPSIVYWTSFKIPLKLSLAISIISLIVAGILISYFKQKRNKE